MSDEDKDASQPQNAGNGGAGDKAPDGNVGSEVENSVSSPGEIARIVTSTNRDAFDNLYVDSGGKPKWKSREKFIMAGCTLLKQVTAGYLFMLRGKGGNGKDATKIDVIEIAIPAKRIGKNAAEKAEIEEEAKEEEPVPEPEISEVESAFGQNAGHPVARYFVLVSKVLKAENDRDKVVTDAEKVVTSAQKTLDSFLNNNWDVLKKSKLISPAVEKEMKERARAEDEKKWKDNEGHRKEMAKLEMEAERDKP